MDRQGAHLAQVRTQQYSPPARRHDLEAYAGASAPAVFRSRSEIEALFAGFELVEPGLVEVSDWRSSHRGSAHPPALRFLAGIGRKL